MDAFSEILSGVKLKGAFYFTAEFSAPWGGSTPASNTMAARLAPGAEHLVLYHLVIEGGAVVEMLDGESIELRPGDVVIFPHGDAHHISSGKGAIRPFPNYGITAKIEAHDLSPLRAGGTGESSRFVCGYMTCDPYHSRPILSGLPPVFKVNIRTDSRIPIKHCGKKVTSRDCGIHAPIRRSSRSVAWDNAAATGFGPGLRRRHHGDSLGPLGG